MRAEIASRHAEITSRFGGLPDTQQVASYNYIDQLVMFEKLEVGDIRKAASGKTLEARWPFHLELWTNAWHEYRHWLDMTSSVFGLLWLNEIATLLQELGKGDEAPTLQEQCQRVARALAGIHLPAYYSTVDNPLPKPWKYQPTVGQAFLTDGSINPQHPIWFVRFASTDDVPIARQPISPASLMEVRAVESEMLGGYGLLSGLPKTDFKLIEQQHFGAAFLERIYHPELTVYSAPAHWYANHRNVTDVAEAYRASASLAWFCMDAPSAWLKSLTPTKPFQQVYGPEISGKLKASFERADRGALFFMLAGDERIKTAKNFTEELSTLVYDEWDTALDDIEKSSHAEGQALLEDLKALPVALHPLLEIWRENHKARGTKEPQISGPRIRLPAVILADDTTLNPFRMKWGERAFDAKVFDPRPYFEEFWEASKYLGKYGTYSENGLHCFSV